MDSKPVYAGRSLRPIALLAVSFALAVHIATPAAALTGNGHIQSYTVLSGGDWFGAAVAPIGDLDGDGVVDLAVGRAQFHSGTDVGDLHVVLLHADGSVRAEQVIGDGQGGFTGSLAAGDQFGAAVAAIGDLDGDGVTELAVGAAGADEAGSEDVGALWILFLQIDGTVKEQHVITSDEWGFPSPLSEYGNFGTSVDPIGDLDGDGLNEIAVGAAWDYQPGSRQGSVTILFLTPFGTVKKSQKISRVDGGFTGEIHDYDLFGMGVAGLGDVDADGVPDLAVAAEHDTDGGAFNGAVWLLLLNGDGTVKSHAKISDTQGDFGGDFSEESHFGSDVSAVGDVDGDGIGDLLVGHYTYLDHGAVWLLLLNADLTVKDYRLIAPGINGFEAPATDLYYFGWATSALGDLNGDGRVDFAVGAPGSVFLLFGGDAPDALCTAAPLPACESDGESRLLVRTNRNSVGKDRLQWKWKSLAAPAAGFGDPLASTTYAVCVWDGVALADQFKTDLVVGSGTGWSADAGGYRYDDADGLVDGVTLLRLRAASNGRQSLQLKASGASLRSPLAYARDQFFALVPQLTVQLVSSDGDCWSAGYAAAISTSSRKFVAK